MSKHHSHVPCYRNTTECTDNSVLEAAHEAVWTESSYVSSFSDYGCTDERVDDNEACGSLDIQLDFLTRAANLSMFRRDDASPTFEEESLLAFDYEFISTLKSHSYGNFARISSPMLLFNSQQKQLLNIVPNLSANEDHNLVNRWPEE